MPLNIPVGRVVNLPLFTSKVNGVLTDPTPTFTASFADELGGVNPWTVTHIGTGRFQVLGFSQSSVMAGIMTYSTSDPTVEVSSWDEDITIGYIEDTNLATWRGTQPNALQSGRVDGHVGAVASGVIAAASFASGALDAVWSTAARTLTSISDSAGITTLLSRIGSALTITAGKVDVNDKTGFALTSGEHTGIAADAQVGLLAQGYTTTRAGYLDVLNGLVPAIWASAARTLTAFGFNVTVATNNDKTGYSLAVAPPTVAAIWDELLALHTVVGSTGAALTQAISAQDAWATDVAAGSYSGGQAGKWLADIREQALLISADILNFVGLVDVVTSSFILYRTADYLTTSGLVLPTWTNADWSVYDLSTAEVVLRAKVGSEDAFGINLIVVSDTEVRLEVSADAATFDATGKSNPYDYQIWATLLNGDRVPLATGKFYVVEEL